MAKSSPAFTARPSIIAPPSIIANAVVRENGETPAKMLDKAFAFAFRGLVYAQIWEDPVVDMQALALDADSRIITIASGGCNALSYLTGNPASITAVDQTRRRTSSNAVPLASPYSMRRSPVSQKFR